MITLVHMVTGHLAEQSGARFPEGERNVSLSSGTMLAPIQWVPSVLS